MCGLTGIFSFSPSKWPVSKSALIKMRDQMIHRGPDGSGIWIDNELRIGLAHRRLAIIDLSQKAQQPMCSTDNTVQVVFNGEIYNHEKIRSELKDLGYKDWITDHSDTEVILKAFQEWGINCIKKFHGMFAIALWDSKKKELWLVRDRIGIKPLYYAITKKGLVFASEIKAILSDPSYPKKVNEEAFFHYLSFLTIPAPLTLFDGINKLAAGTLLQISSSGETKVHQWWDVLDHINHETETDKDLVAARILAELKKAVDYRKVGDVPIGVFLSGGVDSSSNVALFSEGEEKQLNTFSVGYDKTQKSVQDELPYARLIAKRYNSNHNEIILTRKELIKFLPDMIRYQDEPIGDPVCVPLYYVSKLAKENNIKVCQVGEGADELFWGYSSWKIFILLERLNRLPIPRFFKKIGVTSLNFLGLGTKLYTEFLRRASEGLPIFWGGAEAFTEKAKREILSERLQEKFKHESSWNIIKPIRDNFESKSFDKSPLTWMSYLDLKMRLPELLLMRVDKMCMATSVEARVPFLDHKFVEYVMGISPNLKMKHGNSKYILKMAVKNLIPKIILNRKKQGFQVPLDDWLTGELGNDVNKKLREFCSKTDFFDPKGLEKLISRGSNRQIWYLLNFVLWWDEYIQEKD